MSLQDVPASALDPPVPPGVPASVNLGTAMNGEKLQSQRDVALVGQTTLT
jgi:hypothetical protein